MDLDLGKVHGDDGVMTDPSLTGSERGVADSPSETAATPLTFVDVFAGCGGLSLGLKRAGWRGLFAIEKDAFAFSTLSANFLTEDAVHKFDWPVSIEQRPWDVHSLMEERGDAISALAGSVDLLAGGPPCQGFSHAGRRSADDPRNRLFEDYLNLVAMLRPRAVLIENVRGFTSDFQRSSEGGVKNFAQALKERLAADYDTVDAILKASEYGVPQSRHRFFLIGIRREENKRTDLLKFFDNLSKSSSGFLAERKLDKSPTALDAIGDLEVRKNGVKPCPDSAGFQSIDYKGPRTPFQSFVRDGSVGVPSDTRLAKHRPDIEARFSDIIKQCGEDGRLNVSLSPEMREQYKLKKMALRVMDPLAPAPTITSLPDDLLHYSEPRTLTVRENARLQTFPDWFVFKGKYTTGGESRRREIPRFTQVANAVPPLLAEQIGLTLSSVLKL